MDKGKVVFFGILMALVGAIVPISLMAWLSWQRALDNERQRLERYAEQLIEQKDRTFARATDVLRQLVDFPEPPCSDAHIARIRRMTVNERAVEELGYFEHRLLKCTSWGRVDMAIEQNQADYVTAQGVAVTLWMEPIVTGADPMMALHLGAHNALVNLRRFTDVKPGPGLHLAIARTGGPLIAEWGVADHDLTRLILSGRAPAEDADHFHAEVTRDGWTAVVVSEKDAMRAALREERLWMLPVAGFISVFIVILVILLSRQRMSPRAELALAVRKKEFVVHYQPIIDLRSRRCIGAEALIRWRRPDGSMVRPDLFIPLAEETGLVLPMTDLVIETVVAELGQALVADRGLHVAINLCADDIKTGRVLGVIARALEGSGIHPEQVWLEATERGFMDIESARATLASARERGHATAIDDFGTGYSSLAYLQGLPMDALKIDKSFVSTIGTGAVSGSVIGHIIDMAQSLKLQIVAEGVETPAQEAFLLARGVDFAQGWLYAKALPANAFIRYHRASLAGRATAAPTVPVPLAELAVPG